MHSAKYSAKRERSQKKCNSNLICYQSNVESTGVYISLIAVSKQKWGWDLQIFCHSALCVAVPN